MCNYDFQEPEKKRKKRKAKKRKSYTLKDHQKGWES